MTAIATENLGRRFDGRPAVEALDLTVEPGEVFGLLGPNGAGKTTTLRMLTGLIAPTTGRAWILDREVTDRSEALAVRRRIGLLPEAPGLYAGLTPEENLDFSARLHGMPPAERRRRIRELLGWLDLWDLRGRRVATFSRGMQQKVALARALVHDPDILFLDEPTAALDPGASRAVRDLLRGLQEDGRTIFLNTHHLDEASRICDRIGVLNRRLLAQGTPEDLAAPSRRGVSVFRLQAPDEGIVRALEGLDFVQGVSHENGRLRVETADPERFNPALVRAIVEAGGAIEALTEGRPGLEEVYLRLVGDDA